MQTIRGMFIQSLSNGFLIIITVFIDLFTAEMLSIQQGLECVTEHLTEGTHLIDQLQQADMDSHGMALHNCFPPSMSVLDCWIHY